MKEFYHGALLSVARVQLIEVRFCRHWFKTLAQKRNVFNVTLLICSLTFQLFQTDEAFTLNERKHTHARTHTHDTSRYNLGFSIINLNNIVAINCIQLRFVKCNFYWIEKIIKRKIDSISAFL